jgi:hypothetical protein
MATLLLSVLLLGIATKTECDFLPGLDPSRPAEICDNAWEYTDTTGEMEEGKVLPSPYSISSNITSYLAGQPVQGKQLMLIVQG